MTIAQTVLAFGLYSAALIAIGAVGFTLQFGITNVLNLAFGAIMTSAIFVHHWLGHGDVAIGTAIVVGAGWGALFSWLLGRFVIQAYVRRGTTLFGMAMVTIALGLIIQYTLEGIQGPTTLSYQVAHNRQFHLGAVVMSDLQLVIIGGAGAVMLAVHLVLRHTRLGLAMRATADDAELSRGCGVSAPGVRTVAWLMSGALCGICGVFLGLSTGSFDASIGGTLFVTVVAAAIIGGIGKPYGAMVGALVVGLTSETAAAVLSPAYKDVIAWGILIVVLALRPQGIFAEYADQRQLVR
jgi:branched-subunit amino acid ABC-type transport system permease component